MVIGDVSSSCTFDIVLLTSGCGPSEVWKCWEARTSVRMALVLPTANRTADLTSERAVSTDVRWRSERQGDGAQSARKADGILGFAQKLHERRRHLGSIFITRVRPACVAGEYTIEVD